MQSKEEISIYQLFDKLIDVISFIRKNIFLLSVFSITLAFLGLLYAFFAKPQYEAKTTFVLSSNNANNGLVGIASQLGFNLGNAGNDAFTDENIFTLFKSVSLGEKVLFRKAGNSNLSLINLFCESQGLTKAWEGKERLQHAFPFPDNAQKMSLVQDSLFREVHAAIVKSNLDIQRQDEESNVFEIITTSKNQTFSFYFTQYIVEETTAFYVATKTKIAKQNLDMLYHEADSLNNLMGKAMLSTSISQDQVFNLNPSYQINRTPIQKNQAQVSVLATAYGEVIKNLEIAKITLQKETPLIQIIDNPRNPLKAKKVRKIYALLGGGILGFIVGLVFIFIKEVLQSRKQNSKIRL